MTTVTAKSVVFDIEDNWGYSAYLGVRSIEFYNGASKLSISSANSMTYAEASPYTWAEGERAFDTSLSKTGTAINTVWLALDSVNVRITIVFDTEQTFSSIVINNYHGSGSNITYGIKNFTVQYSSESITSTIYNDPVASSAYIFASQINAHVATDTEDDQTVTLVFPSIDLSLPLMQVESVGWLGNAAIMPSFPSLESSIEATSWPLGIFLDLPMKTVSMSASFAPRYADIEASFPAIAISGSLTANKIDFDFKLPVFTATMNGYNRIAFELPVIDFVFSGNSSRIASLTFDLSTLLVESFAGAVANIFIPMMLFDGTSLGCSSQASIDINLPIIESSFISNGCFLSNFDSLFPMFSVNISANPAIVGELIFSKEQLVFSSLGDVGNIGNIDFTSAGLICSLEGDASILSQLLCSLPLIQIENNSFNFIDSALHHIREAIR